MSMVDDDFQLCLLCQRAQDDGTGAVEDIEYLISNGAMAIRGTEVDDLIGGMGIIDVIRDLRILPWYDERVGWAHAGMLKGALALWEEVEFFFPPKTATITGHSLGAGIGLLLSHLLVNKGIPVRFVGFGTPRCMISQIDPRIDATFYRNGNDFITHVPRFWMGGYKRLPVTEIGEKGGPSLKDHHIEGYLDSLMARL